MSAKTIFIVILTILVTIVLMKNTDQVIFWIFGDRYIPKLAVLGTMFGIGFIVGFLLAKPRKKTEKPLTEEFQTNRNNTTEEFTDPYKSDLNDEDRKYID